MFCANCGKKLEDGSNFCPACGASVNGTPASRDKGVYVRLPDMGGLARRIGGLQSEEKKGYLIAMAGIMVFVMLGLILPIIQVKLEAFGYSYKENYNLFQLFDKMETLEQMFDLDIDVLIILSIGSFLGYIVCIIAGLKFFWDLIAGRRFWEITLPVKISMCSGEIAAILSAIFVLCVNETTEQELYGGKFFAVSFWGWILMIIPLINLFFVLRGYMAGQRREINRERRAEYERMTKEKVCLVCKTTYIIGNKCPKCGSSATV